MRLALDDESEGSEGSETRYIYTIVLTSRREGALHDTKATT